MLILYSKTVQDWPIQILHKLKSKDSFSIKIIISNDVEKWQLLDGLRFIKNIIEKHNKIKIIMDKQDTLL